MRDDFVLDSDAPAGGLQRTLIDRFLRDTQRGNTEQFATAFVLLARSLGVDARVATGFVVDEPRRRARSTLSSRRCGDLAGGRADRRHVGRLRPGARRGGDRPDAARAANRRSRHRPRPSHRSPRHPSRQRDRPTPTTRPTDVDADALSTVVLWATRVDGRPCASCSSRSSSASGRVGDQVPAPAPAAARTTSPPIGFAGPGRRRPTGSSTPASTFPSRPPTTRSPDAAIRSRRTPTASCIGSPC